MKTRLLTFMSLTLLGATSLGQDQSWMGRPDIRQVREVYQEVQAAVAEGRYTSQTRRFISCDPTETFRAIYVDSSEVVRLYVVEGGSDDSASEVSYYYDSNGVLRFAFAKRHARSIDSESSELEERYCCNEAFDSIYADLRVVAGPGYYWVKPEPVSQPKDAFNADAACPERKTGGCGVFLSDG
jgi:hypothetical protein